jgi:hypothetical protein
MIKSRFLGVIAVFAASTSIGAIGQNSCVNTDSASSAICINMVRAGFGLGGGPQETKITIEAHFIDTYSGGSEPDFFQVRFSESTNSAGLVFIRQDKTGKGWDGDWKITQPYLPGVEGPPYLIQVQSCNKSPLAHAACSLWGNVNYTPPPPQYIAPPTGKAQPGSNPDSSNKHADPKQAPPAGPNLAESPRPCLPGFVWRQAVAMDYVCVTPQTRAQAAADDKAMKQRTASNGTCIQGYVWRMTVPLDHVCVTPETRDQAQRDNAAMNQRVASQRAPQ